MYHWRMGAAASQRRRLLLELAPAALLAVLWIKLVMGSHALDLDWYPRDRHVESAALAALLLPSAALALLARTRRYGAAWLLDLLLTALLWGDLVHFRFYRELLSIAQLSSVGQLPLATASIASLWRPTDALLGLDLVIGAALFTLYRRTCRSARALLVGRARPGAAAGVLLAAALVAVPALRTIVLDRQEVYAYAYTRQQVVAGIGLLPYHYYDAASHLAFTVRGRLTTSARDSEEVSRFLEQLGRKEGARSPLFGAARGRNLIILMAESLQAFPIGLEVAGQHVAPALEALAAESLSFVEFYDQTHLGTTSDAELSSLHALHPLPAGAAATRYPTNTWRGLPALLSERGYTTLSAVGARGDAWNMWQVHPRLGFGHTFFAQHFVVREPFGPGIPDAEFLPQAVELLRRQPRPFAAFLMSVTNHHPYAMPRRHRHLRLGEPDTTFLGDYLQGVHYFDRALGDFVARLRAVGLLDESVVAVFGDHHGYLDRPPELARLMNVDPQDEHARWTLERRLPFMIRLPSAQSAGPRSVPAGHLDVAPTLLSLLGVSPRLLVGLGRDLTREDASPLVVFRDGAFLDRDVHCLGRPERAGSSRCHATRTGQPTSAGPLVGRLNTAAARLAISDRIIRGNLVPVLSAQLERRWNQ